MEETTEYGEDPAGRDTFASRFTATVVKFLSKGCEASNKEPRYWTMQVMKEIASNLGDIEFVCCPFIDSRVSSSPAVAKSSTSCATSFGRVWRTRMPRYEQPPSRLYVYTLRVPQKRSHPRSNSIRSESYFVLWRKTNLSTSSSIS